MWGGCRSSRDAAHDRLAWDVYLLRCTRVDKGQSRRGSPGAHGRGRQPSALLLNPSPASCQIGRAVRNGKADLEARGVTGFLLSLFNETFFLLPAALHDAFALEHCFRKACTAAQHA